MKTNYAIDFPSYDYVIVFYSGGKDSTACLLHLLDCGVPREKIELWHHDVDGNSQTFMDWECTPAYCKAIAEAFRVPIRFSFKEGGFRREMLRDKRLTAPITFEDDQGRWFTTGGVSGVPATRRKFPQVSADLSVRWCSAYLKIDVAAAAIRNQARFRGKRTLVISGERAEESTARAKYNVFEVHRSDARNGNLARYVDHWRPIKDWAERDVWNIIMKYGVLPHPAYWLGFNRTSCKFCIFGNENQFKTAAEISPEIWEQIISLEEEFGITLKRNKSLVELISTGNTYEVANFKAWAAIATSKKAFKYPVIVMDWKLPPGAFAQGGGPS